MPAIDLGQFLDRLERSNLLTRDDLEALHAEIDPVRDVVQVEPLSRKLVRRGQLTGWQVQRLLSGRDDFQLGNYRLLDLLGRGGMGTVFKAEHVVLGRVVAVKVMARQLVKSSKHVARFQQEIQAVAAIDHPNVVRAIDAESDGDSHFLVMEYVEGADLGSVADRRGRLGVGEACEFIRQAALGLAAAHQLGLVHRDLKPSNLMLTWTTDDQPQVKILDLGLARFAGSEQDDGSLTKTGQMMGTPDYMSPEQAWDTKAVDIRGDIYSLGCTLFRFLVGSPPFQGENPFQTLMVRTTLEAPASRTLDPGIPEDLDTVVTRMLRRDVTERFQDPQEVVEALARFATPPSRFEVEKTPSVEPATSLTLTDATDQPTQVAGASLDQFLDSVRPAGSVETAEMPSTGASPVRRYAPVIGGVVAVLVLVTAWRMFSAPGRPQADPPATDVGRSVVLPGVVKHPEQSIDEQQPFEQDLLGSSHPLAGQLQDPNREFRVRPGGPDGVSVDRRGRLKWTPDESQGPGRHTVVVESRPGAGANWQAVAETVLRVREVDRPPHLDSPGQHEIDELKELEVRLAATDPDRPANLIEYTLGNDAPKGMVVDRRTGRLTWTPTEAQGPGEFRVTVRATAYDAEVVDPKRQQVESTLVVNVAEVDQPPRLRTIPSLSMRVGQRLRLRVRADDPDDPPGEVRFSLQGQVPSGAAIDPTTGIFSWAPRKPHARAWRFRIRAASAENDELFNEGLLLLDVRPPRVTSRGEAVPPVADRTAASADVRDVFRPLLSQARTPVSRSRLAMDIIEQARETADSARAHALFELAHQTALRARQTAVALEVVRAWRQRFQVDLVGKTLMSFKVLNLKELDSAVRNEISEEALRAFVPAVNAGRLAEARQLLGHAIGSIRGDPGEMARLKNAKGLLEQISAENTGEPENPLKLTPKGKVALGGLDKLLKRARFTPLFRDKAKLSFVQHSGDDLEDLGRSLWIISGGDIRLETPARAGASGFWDKSASLKNFRLRARLSADTTTGSLLIGGPASGQFDGLQLEFAPSRFCQLYHRGSRMAVSGPKRTPPRSPLGWDRLELFVRNSHVIVRLNGQALVDSDVPGGLEGFLGLDARLLPDGQPVARLRLLRVRVRVEQER